MDFESALQSVADRFHSTPEAVLRNMQEVVDAGFDNPDPAIRAAWRRIPHKGERPTPEETVTGVAARLKRASSAPCRKKQTFFELRRNAGTGKQI